MATAFSVDRKDELTNAFGAAYSYDNNGNLTSGTNAHQSYLYDDENQLAQWFSYLFSTNSLSGGDLRTDFVYDGQGRLRKRLEYVWNSGGGGPVFLTPSWQLVSETHYIYDGLRVIQERNGSNTPTVSYTRGSDLSGGLEGAGGIGGLLARSHGYSGGTWTTHNFYHADGNGNITYMVNSSQSSVATYKYDPFGNLISSSGTLAGANVYRFSSKEQHANSGMYYYAYRFYDPNLQRWLNRDPIDEDGGINLYRFVGNSSLTWVDPFGLVLRIDPSAPAEFRDHMRDCIKNLINNSPTGKQLVKEAIDDPHTITIAPDPGGAQTIGSVKSKDDRVWPQNPTVNMHPKMPNGMAPDDYRQAKKLGEAPPNDLNGCGVSLAHELGHAVHDYNEPDNIRKVENPVRQDFNLEPRKTYHGIPILEKL